MSLKKEIKIFLPEKVSHNFLYLQGKLVEDKEFYKFFVIKYLKNIRTIDQKDCVGVIFKESSESRSSRFPILNSNFLEVDVNESNEITKIEAHINGTLLENPNYMVIKYNPDRFNQLAKNVLENHESLVRNDFLQLANLVQSAYFPTKLEQITNNCYQKFFEWFMVICNIFSKILRPFSVVFDNTAICRHFRDWKSYLKDENCFEGSILFDILMGILVFAVLNHTHLPGRYFMELTEEIVYKLRDLLEMLKGSPVGLKLNVQLNNFLLDCFVYHVDLWWNFIIIVKPAIHYLFFPLTVMGLFGLSFQCALLCDLLVLLTLHAHCFYIYAALLYKIELSGIQSLFRIVLGRRKNILRDRVESQEYSNRQLYVATLCFTVLLFLLPTVLVYYVVFASLRFLIYCPTYILITIQRKLLMFPFYTYLRWIFGSYVNLNNLEMTFISNKILNNSNLITLKIEPNVSKPWQKDVFERETISKIKKPSSLLSFFGCLVQGKLMAFTKIDDQV